MIPVVGEGRLWEDPEVTALHRLPMGNVGVGFDDADDARASEPTGVRASRWRRDLGGRRRFRLFAHPDRVPASAVTAAVPSDDPGWTSIGVPGNWTLQDVVDDDGEAALAGIEPPGRQTTTEPRAILGGPRGAADHADHRDRGDRFGGNVGTSIGSGGGGERAPQPSLADLDQLTATADLPLHVSVVGDVSTLPQSATLTGYRVVQEALTNIRRHGGDVRRVDVEIVVELGVRPGALRISVLDDGRGAAADDVGGGFGVMGMHERVTAIGGTISTGPRPGGGWRVAADIPVDVAFDTTADAAGDVASVDRTPASGLARQRVDR